MTELFLHDRHVKTVFDLLGSHENDITYSVGWALRQSREFLVNLLADLLPGRCVGDQVSIRLQDYDKGGGYTDIEIVAGGLHIIVEAKRGWALPSDEQLLKYAPRLDPTAPDNLVAVMAGCIGEFADGQLAKVPSPIPILYRSWRQVYQIAQRSSKKGSHAEKRLLKEWLQYLEGLVDMQNQVLRSSPATR